MITTKLQGGLGNQLFQVAAAEGTSYNLGTECTIPINWPYAYYFKGPFVLDDYHLPVYKEIRFAFDPINQDNIMLDGYWQSEKYFKHCSGLIKRAFQPIQEYEDQINDKYGELIKQKDTCAIHVRRGDYLNLSEYHTNLGLDYYERAISKMGDDKYFVCFSDDIEFCKENIFADEYISNKGQSGDMLDFFLMCKMDHFIIANSSFSWWASYLGANEDKIIITPKNWFGPKKAHLDTSDLYTDSMIVI